jgi:two-component system chemotaxis response regulator CheY
MVEKRGPKNGLFRGARRVRSLPWAYARCNLTCRTCERAPTPKNANAGNMLSGAADGARSGVGDGSLVMVVIAGIARVCFAGSRQTRRTTMASIAMTRTPDGARLGPGPGSRNTPTPDRPGAGAADPVHDQLIGLSYLVVGGSRYARQAIKSALNGFGCHTMTECETGEHALKTIAAGGIDAVLAEYELPGMTGAELVWHVRHLKNERYRRLTVVMIGNDAVADHVRDAVDAGVNEYLPKPYARRDLHARLRRAVLAPKPFVDTPRYAGPDRRHVDTGSPRGVDRRGPAFSMQLLQAGAEPKWVKTVKLGSGTADDGKAPDPVASGTKAAEPAPVSAAPPASNPPAFSVLAEITPTGRGGKNASD